MEALLAAVVYPIPPRRVDEPAASVLGSNNTTLKRLLAIWSARRLQNENQTTKTHTPSLRTFVMTFMKTEKNKKKLKTFVARPQGGFALGNCIRVSDSLLPLPSALKEIKWMKYQISPPLSRPLLTKASSRFSFSFFLCTPFPSLVRLLNELPQHCRDLSARVSIRTTTRKKF